MKLMQYAQTSKNPCKALSYICKYYGTRPDLVQAGGGNISVKENNKLYIKSSGCMLFDVEPNKNISVVNLENVVKPIGNNETEKQFLYKSTIEGSQPSLETFFHSKTKKYTVHLHPIAVIQALHLFKNDVLGTFDSNFVEYYKPGLELANHIDFNKNIIFLDKHGLIVHGNNIYKVAKTVETIIDYCEKLLNYDLKKYENLSKIQEDIFLRYGKIFYVMSTDVNFKALKCTPDCVIYSGAAVYENKYDWKEIPTCIDFNGKFIVGNNFLKCKQIEEVLKMYENVDTELSAADICKLQNWDSEKYRKSC